MNDYIAVLKKYAVFSGRAGRKEFWMFVLINLIINVILTLLTNNVSDFFNIISIIYSLAILVPSLAVGVRRMHDTDRSGWWLLINLVPFVGTIIYIVFAAMKGTSGSNKYGAEAGK